jgi:rod shape-determining protein MreD
MRRRIVVGILIWVCLILQSTVFQSLSLGSITPNLLIVLTSTYGFMRGKKEGLVIGFICGFMIDLLYGEILGMNALIYMYIGYINGFFNKIFYDDDIKLPMILITVSDLIYGILTYLILFLIRGRSDFMYYLSRIIIPEVVYTVLVTIVLYQVILAINHKLEAMEKRGANRFV